MLSKFLYLRLTRADRFVALSYTYYGVMMSFVLFRHAALATLMLVSPDEVVFFLVCACTTQHIHLIRNKIIICLLLV